ncbi:MULTISPECIES: GGDEF domain-containing protein [Clostridium]|uniref:Putative diguanylate cyclase YdaM n=1 Tax=Clostridium ragsdalei P11 TaxID=1353534 RepID=A0A1A6AVV1_9CLOT|nr:MULTISPECIES: GGDEF domain-containing protein [Clostridium]OBR94155.1 putative diguanylate cyclase YdaM [Clostridium ragsdalei P11]QXE20952.1 GGDEF domain-containing protein [Clostridium sp. 001]
MKISTIALFIATLFAKLVSNINDVNYTQNLIYIFRNCINILFFLAAYLGIGKYYKTALNLVSDKTIRYMSLYPVTAFLLLITNFTTPTHIAHLRNFNSAYDMILFLLFILLGYILVFMGISSASQIVSMQCNLEKLELISKTDSLTGLYNRRYIMEKLENEFINYKKSKNKFSLILADIDYFKKINDSFGHDCGDQVLKAVAQNLHNAVRERGFVSRWGGEEFLILLPETEIHDAHILANKIRETIEKEIIEYNGIQLSITLTFGVTVNEDYETIGDTIKKADDALYTGKGEGRNCVVLS